MILLYVCAAIVAVVLWAGMIDFFFVRPWIMRKTWGRPKGGTHPLPSALSGAGQSEPPRLQDLPDRKGNGCAF